MAEVQERSLRETLNEAFDADQTQQEHVDGDVSTEVPGDGEPVVPGTSKPGGKPAGTEVEEGTEQDGASQRKRDASGKFVKTSQRPKGGVSTDTGGEPGTKEEPLSTGPKAGAKVAPKPGEAGEADVQEAQRRLAASRAPGSWRPAIREKWARLDPEVQHEILRRERDMTRGMTEITAAREFQQQFAQVLQPYQHIIAAEGGQPLAVVNNLFATAAALSHGSPAQKAQTVASIIQNFGVDLPMLDEILSKGSVATQQPRGGAPGGGNTQMAEQYIQQAVRQALAPILQGQQQREQALEESVNQDIDAFAADPANEFFEDVRELMADVLEIAAKRGQKMDLSTAYKHATLMHSEIAPIVQARGLASRPNTGHQAAQAARRKAVSVTGAPAAAPGVSTRGESLRDDLENAIDSLS